MMLRNGTFTNGNDKFHGFLKDLLERLKKDLDFEYVLHEVRDKSYGVLQKDGTWNGLIGELIDKVFTIYSHSAHYITMNSLYRYDFFLIMKH